MSVEKDSAALTSETPILTVPPELLLKIMEHMTPTTVQNFALSCKRNFAVFADNKDFIMAKLIRGLPEFNTMLLLHTAHRHEMHPEHILHPRIIDYDSGSSVTNLMGADIEPGTTVIPRRINNARVFLPGELLKFTLKPLDIQEMWRKATIIDWWVELYPRLYWRDDPLSRRCLVDTEEDRARKAVAHWWLYAHYHHGFAYHYRNSQEPKRWSKDTRLHVIRVMPTNEICELKDLWEMVKSAVSKDLCSSPERVCVCKGTHGVDLVPWGAPELRHPTIVDTYAKLNPEQLKYYLNYFSNWKKPETIKSIIRDSRGDFHRDTETLSVSIQKVIDERLIIKNSDDPQDKPFFGILNQSRMDSQRAPGWMNDGWSDGKVPLTQEEISMFPYEPALRVSRGDNGLDDYCPH
ncbi:hypothetical protein F5B19DRAFT_368533 [Rostrohypoxylon terebratum]|nr:hypothetical protein F5B19DRAFT_368533 [Rostrohypoxylon terebratum]